MIPLLIFLIVVFSLCILVENHLLDICWQLLPVSGMTFVNDASHGTGVLFFILVEFNVSVLSYMNLGHNTHHQTQCYQDIFPTLFYRQLVSLIFLI